MHMRKTALIGAIMILLAAFAAAQEPDLDAILRSIDEFGTFNDADFSAEYTIVSDKPGEERSIFKARIFRRDSEEKFLLLILEPVLQRGEGYLQVGETGWSYDPESREFAIFNLSDSFQDSEARNSDFDDSDLSDNYRVTGYEEGTLGQYEVYVLDLEALNDTVAYPTMRIWVRRDNYLLLKEEDYSLSGRLLRTSYFPSYARAGGYFIPTKMLFVDNLNEGERSEVTIRNISFDRIPDSVFTRSYLEQVNR
jgi:outer membrane lipoprotein-sorting protein